MSVNPKAEDNAAKVGVSPQALLAVLERMSPVMAKDFAGIQANLPTSLHAKHPHIFERLALLWGEKDATAYLDSLMVSDRADRAGFGAPVIGDLFFLRQLHEFLHPSELSARRVEDLMHGVARPRNLRELVDRYGQNAESDVRHTRDPLADSPLRPRGWGEIGSMEELRAALLAPAKLQKAPRIGEILVAAGVLTEEQVSAALETQKRLTFPHKPLGEILVSEGLIEEEDVIKARCVQSRCLLVDLDAIPMTHEAAKSVAHDVAREHSIIPLLRIDRLLCLVVEEPLLPRALSSVDFIEATTKLQVKVAWAPSAAIARRLRQYVPGRIEKRL